MIVPKKYKSLALFNFGGFAFYTVLTIATLTPELAVCAGIWFVSFVLSFKAYLNAKFRRGGKKA